MRHVGATLLTLLLLFASAARAETLQIAVGGRLADISSIVVAADSGDQETSLLEDGAITALDVASFVGERNRPVEASLQIEFARAFLIEKPMTLVLGLQLARCLGPCESRLIRIPNVGGAYNENDARSRCEGSGGKRFSPRTETLLFCQAVHRFLLSVGEGGSELGDVSLNGWYRSAFELHSFHQMQGLRFVARDTDVEARILTRINNGLYQQRIKVSPDVFQDERDQLNSAGREALRYLDISLRTVGPQPDLREWTEELTDVFLRDVTSAYPPTDEDFALLASIRELAKLPPME